MVASITNSTFIIFPIDIKICSDSSSTLIEFIKYIWISIHILECFMLLILVIGLRKIRDEFNISNELLFIGCMWIIFETFFLINSNAVELTQQRVILMLELARNYITVIISGLIPLIKSYQVLNLPICATKECASNFNLLLYTEKTYNAFFCYLKSYMPEGAKFLSFYTELNVFKHSLNHNEINILSTDIYQKYLNENSQFYIDFPPHLLENLHSAYQSSEKTSYSGVYENLGNYVYATLKDYYYPNFKMSSEYKSLESDLEMDEAIYSRLVASSMIQSSDID